MKISIEGQKLFNQLQEGYNINDPGGVAILTEAICAWDLSKLAQNEIDKHGVIIQDRYKQLKSNPAVSCLRDSRAQFLQCLKALNLDLSPEQIEKTKFKI